MTCARAYALARLAPPIIGKPRPTIGKLPKGVWVPDQGVAPYRGRG